MAGVGTVSILARNLFLIGELDCWPFDVLFGIFGNPQEIANTGKDPKRRLNQPPRRSSTRSTSRQPHAKHATQVRYHLLFFPHGRMENLLSHEKT